MGIEKINNIRYVPVILDKNTIQNKDNIQHNFQNKNISFSGKEKVVADTIQKALGELMPWHVNIVKKAHAGMGEIQNQLINAVGTGLIAPVFIKYNPLSNKDENKRTYTAWRQPISAVLAIATQAAIVKPFNDLIRRWSDNGMTDLAHNATFCPSNHHIEKLIREENKGKKFTKEEMKAAVEARKKQITNSLVSMIDNDQITFKTVDWKGKETKVKMPDSEFKGLFNDALNELIKSEERERSIALGKKYNSELKRSMFYYQHPEDARDILRQVQKEIVQLDTVSDGGSSSAACKKMKKSCENIIKRIKSDTKNHPNKEEINKELINIVKELRDKITEKDILSIKILDSKTSNMLKQVDIMSEKKSTKEVMDHISNRIQRRTTAIDGVIETLKNIQNQLNNGGITVKDAQNIIEKNAETYIETGKKALKRELGTTANVFDIPELSENAGIRLKQKVGKISKKIAGQLEKHVKSNIDGAKRYTGLIVSLAILPLTCWLLNRIYPWFMDKVFPEMSHQIGDKPKDKESKDKKEVTK
jgi:hypothetical protein